MTGPLSPAEPEPHDPRCASLTPSECNCSIWHLIDNPPQIGEPPHVTQIRLIEQEAEALEELPRLYVENECLRAALARVASAAGVPDAGVDQVVAAIERLRQRDAQLAKIGRQHTPRADSHGGLSGYCPECELVSPCPTYAWATSERHLTLDPWDPADDQEDTDA